MLTPLEIALLSILTLIGCAVLLWLVSSALEHGRDLSALKASTPLALHPNPPTIQSQLNTISQELSHMSANSDALAAAVNKLAASATTAANTIQAQAATIATQAAEITTLQAQVTSESAVDGLLPAETTQLGQIESVLDAANAAANPQPQAKA